MDDKDAEIARLQAELDARNVAVTSMPEAKGSSGLKGGFFGCFGVMAAIVVAVVAFIVIGSALSAGSSSPGENTQTENSSADNGAAGKTASETWVYTASNDKIDGTTKSACITSSNKVSQSFPYKDTTAELCVRSWPGHGLNVYVQLNDSGQILCLSNECSIRVKFDNAAPSRFSGAEAADNSSNIVFITPASRAVSSLKKAAETAIQIRLYQNGEQTLTFATKGLNWPPLKTAG